MTDLLLQQTLSSDEEDNAKSNKETDDVSKDSSDEEDEADEINSDFEFGGFLVSIYPIFYPVPLTFYVFREKTMKMTTNTHKHQNQYKVGP